MKKNKAINIYLFLLFVVLEMCFVYSIFTQDKIQGDLLKLQVVLNNGVNITILATFLSVTITSVLFLFQYAIAKLLILMFSPYETNIFDYLLPRNIALIINNIIFFTIGINNQIIFSFVILASAVIAARLFYKDTRSLVYAIVFSSPVIVDSSITILMAPFN